MSYLAVAIALGLFIWSFRRSRAAESTGSAVLAAKSAMASLLDPALGDEEKERAARASSGKLLMLSASIAARLVLALAVPTIFLAGLIAAKILNLTSIVNILESWPLIVTSTIVIGAALFWKG